MENGCVLEALFMKKKELLLLFIGAKLLLFSGSILLVGLRCMVSRVMHEDTAFNYAIEVGKPVVYDSDGYTALIRAANCANIDKSTNCLEELKKLLVAGGQPLDAQSHNPDMRSGRPVLNTALHFALFNANYPDFNPENTHFQQVPDLLLDAGVNVRIPNVNGDTPVHFLIQVENLDRRTHLLARFIKRGADVNVRNHSGQTLMHLLVPSMEITFFEILKTKFGPFVHMNIKDNAGRTPYDLSVELGHSDPEHRRVFLEEPKTTIDIYGNLETRDSTLGFTPLMMAVVSGNVEATKQLIDRLANVNAATDDSDKNSILHLVLLAQKVDMVKWLIDQAKPRVENKLNVNIANAVGDRPLHYVLKIDGIGKASEAEGLALRNQAAQFLLENGADINAQNNAGDTVLHLAAAQNAVELVKLLVDKYGSKINLTILNRASQTPLDVARLFKNAEIIALLEALAGKAVRAEKGAVLESSPLSNNNT